MSEQDPKSPETISMAEYTKLKGESETKIADLEGKLKTSITPEALKTSQDELARVKTEHQKAADELIQLKAKTVEEKKTALKSKGLTDDELKDLSPRELDLLIKTSAKFVPKPGADLGGGGGSTGLVGSPMELAQRAYTNSKR